MAPSWGRASNGHFARLTDAEIATRFWGRVARDGAGCWNWCGSVGADGYGKVQAHNKCYRAHRLAWALVNGPIPPGKMVLHRCDNRLCCHAELGGDGGCLFLGDQQVNMQDMKNKGRARAPRGEEQHASKLRESDVLRIRKMYATGRLTQEEIAQKFGVKKMCISKIVRRETWKHVDGAISA
jgi:DNA-binding XRE family transcriptional regulator